MRPPTRIDVSQRSFLGLSYRQLAILAPAAALALAIVVLLSNWPLFLRGAAGVLTLGLGLAWAFGEVDGKNLETWLLELMLFRRRSRHLMHRALRETPDSRRVAWADPKPAAEPVATVQASASAAIAARPGFFYLSATALGAAILTGLTLWLAQGGAQQLNRIWSYL